MALLLCQSHMAPTGAVSWMPWYRNMHEPVGLPTNDRSKLFLGVRVRGVRVCGVRVGGVRFGVRVRGVRVGGIRIGGVRVGGVRVRGVQVRGVQVGGVRVRGVRDGGVRVGGVRVGVVRVGGVRVSGVRVGCVRSEGHRNPRDGLVVNGVKFVFHGRDERLTTQTIGVSMLKEDEFRSEMLLHPHASNMASFGVSIPDFLKAVIILIASSFVEQNSSLGHAMVSMKKSLVYLCSNSNNISLFSS
ncbi:hypothetical protein Tco_0184725 [Tanacetum coccineum]